MSVHSKDFLKTLSDSKDVTGGGSAAALVSGIAVALTLKVLDNEKNKPRQQEIKDEIEDRITLLEEMVERFDSLIDEDPKALRPLIDAYKLPSSTSEEKESRQAKIQAGIETAARPQVEIIELLIELTEQHQFVLSLEPAGEIVTNLAESTLFSQAALRVAHTGAKTNYESLSEDAKREERLEHVDQLLTLGVDRLSNFHTIISRFLETDEWTNI